MGTLFGLIAVMQIVGAIFTCPLSKLTGPMALLYAAPCLMVLSIAVMVAGPEHLGLLVPTLSIQSICVCTLLAFQLEALFAATRLRRS